jgi:homoserine kinase
MSMAQQGNRPARQASAFAPAGVGNIGVGFDLLGHSIHGPGDRATVRRIDAPTVRIVAIDGDSAGTGDLPLEPALNTAGRALMALREEHGITHGFELWLHKGASRWAPGWAVRRPPPWPPWSPPTTCSMHR